MRLAQRKIQSLSALRVISRQVRTQGRTLVFTNGCFDLLHTGHVKLLEHAKRAGDLLIVGINSDRSVRALKGTSRPIMGQRDRALLVAALESVDYVTIFNEPTPQRLITHLQPHVLLKGADWGTSEIVGSAIVRQRGGRIVRFPLLKGLSTSALIQRILKRHHET